MFLWWRGGVLVVVFLWWCFCGGVFGVVFCGGVFVVVFLSLCLCGGVFVVVFLWWCFCVGVVVFLCWCGVLVVVFLWWCFRGGVVVFLWWWFCGGVLVVLFLWWCGGVFVLVWWCFCGGVLVVVFLCWCGDVFVVVFLWWCFCVGVVMFLWWCFCGGVLVVVFVWWCFCGGVFVVVFLWWCFCGGVFVVVFLCWCFCGGVFVVVFLWCGCGGVFVAVFLWWCTKVLLQYYKVLYSSTTPYYSSTTPYYKVLLQYYSVLQSTTPVLQSSTLHNKVILQYYYKVLLQYYSVLQSTTPTSETTSERRPSSTTPYYASTTKASKTSISCEASATFHRKSFQNDRFVRGFLQISQNKLPKRAFRAMLPTIFTEKASKRIVSRDASSKFHRTSFQNERFARCFLQISQNELPKWSFRARLPLNFTEQCSQNERFARCFRQFSPKICVSLQFRVIDTPIPTKGFIRQKQNVPRTTTPCIPKFQNVRFATAACTKMYESIHREPTRFAHTKMWGFTTVLADRHHVFTERVDPQKMKFAFRYSFGRSTPRFYREGCPTAIEICVSLQFWAIDDAFLARGLTARKWNLRFATVLSDRRRVCSERVDREKMKFAFRYSFGRSTTRF